jgi:hypothetical protein
MNAARDILTAMSEHGNYFISKLINYFGLFSFSTGTILGVANDTASKVTGASSDPWGLPDYAALMSILVAISYLVKNAVDSWINYQKFKQDQKGRKDNE